MDDFIATRRVGEAEVTLISDGVTAMRLAALLAVAPEDVRAAVPDATAEGEVECGFLVAHVRLGNASLMIDAGMGPPRPGARARRSPGIAAGLARIGVRPEDVTHVLFTHTHWDHADGALVERDGRAARFPNARHLVGRADWEASQDGAHPYLAPAELAALHQAGLLDPIDGDHLVVPGVTMLDAPGESPGHHAVVVESGGRTFMNVGDLYHHPCEIDRGWFQKGTDPVAGQRSRDRVLGEAVRRGAVVVASHDVLPGWSRVVRTDGRFAVLPQHDGT